MTIFEASMLLNTFKTDKVKSGMEIAKELAMVVPLSETTIKTYLICFIEAGIVVKVGRGKYQMRQTPVYYKWIEASLIRINLKRRAYYHREKSNGK